MSNVGLVGLGVMGQNLALNILEKGFSVTVFNRTPSKVDDFLKKSKRALGSHNLREFCRQLERPRKILLMIKAGRAIDEFIEQLLPFLEKGDIIIDGGNSFYGDTKRRVEELQQKGISFIGCGISGGEEGARHGPSIMPGGDKSAWPQIEPILKAISAKTTKGESCCEWMGNGGAGHFVKMVHNGIEYGIMQLIAETYHLLKEGEYSYAEMYDLFEKWNRGKLKSYLIEITAKILQKREGDGSYLLEHILDVAGQKGTGKWTVESALNLGVSTPLFAEAVFARELSAKKEARVAFSKIFPKIESERLESAFINKLEHALYLAFFISYAQGFALLNAASLEFKWNLPFANIAKVWGEGCIIRSALLSPIFDALQGGEKHLFLDPYWGAVVKEENECLRAVIIQGVKMGIPLPAFSSALAYLDGFHSVNLPINLIQAQRDFFGAHTYERTDSPRGEFFHTEWQ